MNKVSVIIPIFRVEAFIERCARSLMEQTLGEAEFIFVDDCSPDGSMAVLERVLKDYPQRAGQVRIIHHEQNKGLPAARNTGLEVATGGYIFHCDSDDYMERDALKAMYEAAKQQDADIVYSDWFLEIGPSLGRTRYMRCPDYCTPEEALRGLLHGTMKYNVWNKLVKRELYNDIRFPEGHGMGEDMTMILLFAKAQHIAYLPKGTYHYVRQNENAFTASRRTTAEGYFDDLLYNAKRIIKALQGDVSEEDLACFKLNVKFPFLISNQREDYDRWQQWFPEANKHIHSHRVSRRARLLERCANGHLFLPIRLHFYLLQHI
ncbi:MAG: glycosyltransferase family 2 protein [Bacteroidaceae bacterium]|nr:glycosyltransferase family 2 protein [Bacteroidaceae bacterium]